MAKLKVLGVAKSTKCTVGAVDVKVRWYTQIGEVTLVPDPVTGDLATWGSPDMWGDEELLAFAYETQTEKALQGELNAWGARFDPASLD